MNMGKNHFWFKMMSKRENGPNSALSDVTTGFRFQVLDASTGIAWLGVLFMVLLILLIITGPVATENKCQAHSSFWLAILKSEVMFPRN